MNQDPEHFDNLLDRALETYSSNEPRYGLEERILARTTAGTNTQRRPVFGRPAWLWLSAMAAAVVIIAVLLYPNGKRQSAPGSNPRSNTFAKTQLPPTPVIHAPDVPHAVPSAIHASRNPRRPAQTPPQPATPSYGSTQPTRDDLLLARLAMQHPSLAAELAKLPTSSSTPIAVSAIPNQPIAMPAIQVKEITVATVEVAEIH